MRILDWFRSLLGGASASMTGSRAAQSPLELPVGSEFAYYRERYVVTGVRVVTAEERVRFDHCAEGEDGTRVVVSATADGALSLGRVHTQPLDWSADTHVGLGEEPLRLVATHECRVRHEGLGTAGPARQVVSRRFEDEGGDRWLLLEQYGEEREARLCEPIFREELSMGDELVEQPAAEAADAAPLEASPAAGEKGSPAAAALALSGGGDGPAMELDHDPTAYDDDEWADAEFDEEPAAGGLLEDGAGGTAWDSTFPGRGRPVPTFEDDEDDWLDV